MKAYAEPALLCRVHVNHGTGPLMVADYASRVELSCVSFTTGLPEQILGNAKPHDYDAAWRSPTY